MLTIRLSNEERLLYEAEAAYRKQNLSAYLRELLQNSREASFKEPKDTKENTSLSSPHEQGILLEILLILRYLVTPEKLNLVRKDLKRLNIPTWQGESFSKE
jgi:hypothetical protein